MSIEKRKRRGPESAQYDHLKGRIIEIVFPDSAEKHLLVWVDTYTIGVADPKLRGTAMQDIPKDSIEMLYKTDIPRVRLAQ